MKVRHGSKQRWFHRGHRRNQHHPCYPRMPRSKRFRLSLAFSTRPSYRCSSLLPRDRAQALQLIQRGHGRLHALLSLRRAQQDCLSATEMPNARLLFIGEGPGADEDAQGTALCRTSRAATQQHDQCHGPQVASRCTSPTSSSAVRRPIASPSPTRLIPAPSFYFARLTSFAPR